MRRFVFMAVSLVLAGSCVSPRSGTDHGMEFPQDPVAALRQRAETLWTAKAAQDWATVFLFEDPAELQNASKDEFVKWCQEEEPFRVVSFGLGEVLTDEDLGWVEVHYQASLHKFPDIPARDAKMWQKWRRLDHVWYPVPMRELSNYPETPTRRDSAEEAKLHARFRESWAARRTRDWSRLYALTDPADRGDVSEEEYAEVEELFEYLAYDIHWVEVIGDRGRICVSYEHKVTDDSLTKLPAMSATVVEAWIKRDHEWYRDLKHE